MLRRLVPFEALDDPAGLGRFKRFVQRRWRVRVQIVLDQHDLLGFGEVNVGEVAQDFCIIGGRAPFGDLDMAPASELILEVGSLRDVDTT